MIGTGLKPLPPDTENKRIMFGGIFDLPDISELPPQYEVPDVTPVKNQFNSDYCSAFSGCATSEDQENVELDPLYVFFKTKQREGNADWGANLDDMAWVMKEYGAIEAKDSPLTLDHPREIILDPQNWPLELDAKAAVHRKKSYAFVSGGEDFFDSIKLTLWKNRKFNKSIETGILWDHSWTLAPQGFIDFTTGGASGHAFNVRGWMTKNGKEVIKAKLSNGTNVGDKGYFYFTRDIINLCEKFGGITFTDLPQNTIKYLRDNQLKISDLLFTKLWLNVKQLLHL